MIKNLGLAMLCVFLIVVAIIAVELEGIEMKVVAILCVIATISTYRCIKTEGRKENKGSHIPYTRKEIRKDAQNQKIS